MDRLIKITLAVGVWALSISIFSFSMTGYAGKYYEVDMYKLKREIELDCFVYGDGHNHEQSEELIYVKGKIRCR